MNSKEIKNKNDLKRFQAYLDKMKELKDKKKGEQK